MRGPNARPGHRQRDVAGVFADEFGHAEVNDADAPVGIEEQVLGLDVAVEDALGVGVLEGVADAGDEGKGFGRGEASGTHRLPQVDAVDELHEEVTPEIVRSRGRRRCSGAKGGQGNAPRG